MATRFRGGTVWADVTAAISGRGKRRAAIAYLGKDAPRLLPLRRGDVLCVNASDQTLLARATHPDALKYFVDADVRVLSTPKLHAKVIVAGGHAVIGSANASSNSEGLQEAVVITDNKRTVAAASTFIDGLDDITEVDDDFIAAARLVYARGRSGGRAGVDGSIVDPGFLPAEPYRVWLDGNADSYDPSESEAESFKVSARRARREIGPAATYKVGSVSVHRDDKPLRHDDVYICTYYEDGDLWMSPPAVVVSEPIRIRGSVWRIQLLRMRVDLEDVPASEVEAHLQTLGVHSARLDEGRWLRSGALRTGLLDFWEPEGSQP